MTYKIPHAIDMNLIAEITKERAYQIDKWGSDADLNVNTPMDWVGYITHHSSRWFTGGFAPYSEDELKKFRSQMVKVATLAVAAIQSTDAILEGQVNRPDVLRA